mmetsp:Transcript_16982/g.25701  ORF Transcript_16982/g.25701 Transcript_16982/m.25701 type:complete len:334 (+) Transcript_16982:78-1079(+)
MTISNIFILAIILVSVLYCRGNVENSEQPEIRRRLGMSDPRTITMKSAAELSGKSSAASSSSSSSSTQQPALVKNPIPTASTSSSSTQTAASHSTQQQQTSASSNVTSAGNKPTKNLEFIHITKTAGSVIEKLAWDAGIIWGVCHYREEVSIGCNKPDWTKPKKRRFAKMPSGLRYIGEPWHAPSQWLDPNQMEDDDTFVIVRDPYDRLVAEYYCSSFGYSGDNADDPQVFNKWVSEQLDIIKREPKKPGHMLQQRYFVYDQDGERIVTHILRYESLKRDFDALMEYYNLPMRLPEKSDTSFPGPNRHIKNYSENTKKNDQRRSFSTKYPDNQ